MNNVIDAMMETGKGLVFRRDFLEEAVSELNLKRKDSMAG